LRDGGLLSGVVTDWAPPLLKESAWDFSLEELELQPREEVFIEM